MALDKKRLIWFILIVSAALVAPISAISSAQRNGGAQNSAAQNGAAQGDVAQNSAVQNGVAQNAQARQQAAGDGADQARGSETGDQGQQGAAPAAVGQQPAAPLLAQTQAPSRTRQPQQAQQPQQTATRRPRATPTPAPTPTPTPPPPEPIVLTISAVGDCTIGYDETFGYENRFDKVYKDSGYDPKYFFSNALGILGSDDLTIANLETTFTTATKKADKAYRFKGDPSYARILEEGGVDAVNIANNHMYDYLQKGFDDTVATLEGSSVEYFGYDRRVVMDVKGIRVGLAGFHIGGGGWSGRKQAIADALAELRQSADLVIVSFHWGIEGKYAPSADQVSLATFCAYNGADLILGHHTHTLQGVGSVNGKAIAYSLGNFCFGGNRNPKDKDTMIFQQSFEFDGATKKLARSLEPNIIPASVSSVANRNDYRPTPLDGQEAERVMEKIQGLSDGIK
jgi:poly-gamma-glutamate synthesis protein (capsule biosynthesis protein)|nr:CapA family protein [Clostridiales bacterium]